MKKAVKRVWKTKAARRYSDKLSDWRKDWREKGKKPECVAQGTWNNLLKHWDSLAFKKKCATASQNRRTEVGGQGSGLSCHTGGSRSFLEHGEDLTKQLGRLANDFEVFERTHRRKRKKEGEGDYIDKRSTDVVHLVEQLVAAATGASTSGGTQLDMSQIYMKAVESVGGLKKKRVYGLGNKPSAALQTTSSSIPTSHEEVERMRAEARDEGRAEAHAELLHQMDEMKNQMREEIRQQNEHFTKLLQALMLRLGQGTETLPPPTGDEDPIDDEDTDDEDSDDEDTDNEEDARGQE